MISNSEMISMLTSETLVTFWISNKHLGKYIFKVNTLNNVIREYGDLDLINTLLI